MNDEETPDRPADSRPRRPTASSWLDREPRQARVRRPTGIEAGEVEAGQAEGGKVDVGRAGDVRTDRPAAADAVHLGRDHSMN